MFQGVLRGFVRGKFSPRQSKGGSVSPKHLPVGWYKGRNVPSIGKHTAKGGYVLLPEKIPIYVVPDLTNFKLKPYVSPSSKPVPKSNLNFDAVIAANPNATNPNAAKRTKTHKKRATKEKVGTPDTMKEQTQ